MRAEVLNLFSEHQCIQSADGHCVFHTFLGKIQSVTLRLKNEINIKGDKGPN